MVLHQCSRTTDKRATVLMLQSDGRETQFEASYTVPMRALLEEDVIPRTYEFGDKPREVLREFVNELSVGISW